MFWSVVFAKEHFSDSPIQFPFSTSIAQITRLGTLFRIAN